MVRSRSATNIDRILFDLCTSPEIRSAHRHTQTEQRQYHLPLPNIRDIHFHSDSELNNRSNTIQMGLSPPHDRPEPWRPVEFTFPRLPLPSTPMPIMNPKGDNDALVTNSLPLPRLDYNQQPATVIPLNSATACKHDDHLARLRDRLNSRQHLRKLFLS